MKLRDRIRLLPMPCYIVIYGPDCQGGKLGERFTSVHFSGPVSSQKEVSRLISELNYQGPADALEITGVEYDGTPGIASFRTVDDDWHEVSV